MKIDGQLVRPACFLPIQCDESVAVGDDPDAGAFDRDLPGLGNQLAIYPNPFNPQTTITFALDRPKHAHVAVYDLTGRLLGVLASRGYDAGNHSVAWKGCDSDGHAMPSGTYIVRLETETGVEARKVMLLR